MPQPNVNIDPAREAAEARAELLRLAREQGVKPFDFDRVGGDFWPEDESADEFLVWLRSARDDGGRVRRLPE
jgi:predicted TIM-barrel fold metal-dependent hydrolase